ncbi:transposase [Acholeplasma manati]|jgi:transposase|nr:transposase [Paracholeplasma manati]MDG0889668.1 transposase [Paracholeplasma manati]
MSKGQRFTDEFKTQIVRLYQTGKPVTQLSKEYDIATQSIYKWIKETNTTGSFKTNDNLTAEQKELKALRKRTAELEMENDILKQAALIMGRKSKS